MLSYQSEARARNAWLLPKCPLPRDRRQKADRYLMKRVEANDPVALRELGLQFFEEGNFKGVRLNIWQMLLKIGRCACALSVRVYVSQR